MRRGGGRGGWPGMQMGALGFFFSDEKSLGPIKYTTEPIEAKTCPTGCIRRRVPGWVASERMTGGEQI